MPPRKKTPAAAPKAPARHFNFQLSINQVAGVTLVTFCLFLWMFFIGVWAGRTIISPCPSAPAARKNTQEAQPIVQLEATSPKTIPKIAPKAVPSPEQTDPPAIYVQPRERKKRISPHDFPRQQEGL